MTTLSEIDLKELKDFIAQGFVEIKGEIKQLNEQLKALEIGQARLEEQVKAISQNLKDLKQQTEKQDNRFWALVLALFVALLGAVAKGWFFPGTP